MGDASAELPPNCPPEDHFEPDGVYYRYTGAGLSIGDELSDEDWVLPVHKPGPHYRKFDSCSAHALSIFGDKQVLLDARHVMPFARKKTIASVELRPGMGPVAASDSPVGPTHHDWWPAPGAERPPARVVEGRAVM